MLKTAIVIMTVASLVAGCAQTGSMIVSEADRCAQSGGVWQAARVTCDHPGSGGGGGY